MDRKVEVKQYQFVFGGRTTPVVVALIIINVALFILTENLKSRDPEQFIYLLNTFGLVPADVFSRLRLWQFVTSLFLHGSLGHVISNSFFLWFFGCSVEGQWRKWEFILYYLLAGIGGNLFTFAVHPSSHIPCIGASGAIFGVMAAFAVLFGSVKIYLFGMMGVTGRNLVLIAMAIEIIAVVSSTIDGIGHAAHLGGAAAGYIYLKLIQRLSFAKAQKAQKAQEDGPGGSRMKNLEFHE